MGEVASGLEGVVVAETELSDVDGAAGRLIIAGSDVESLAGSVSFEEVFARLNYLPERKPDDKRDAKAAIGAARVEAFEKVKGLKDALSMKDAMETLRASIARLSGSNAEQLTAAMAVFAAAWCRLTTGHEPIAPDPKAGHAADYLRMIRGEDTNAALERAIDAYLVTVIDHGMNASTFTARVIASTNSDLVSSVTGAIGALKGPLHGGAPGPVLDMLDAMGAPEKAETWIRAEIAAGRRIMGMGHRVYRVRDPRAAVLEREVQNLEKGGIEKGRLALARAGEKAAEKVLAEKHPDRPLKANVEFYTAVLLDAIGVPREAFSATFAVSRVGGWTAHVGEQGRKGRLIRPASNYIGKRP